MTDERADALGDLRHCIAIASQSQPDWRGTWEAALSALSASPAGSGQVSSDLKGSDTQPGEDGAVVVSMRRIDMEAGSSLDHGGDLDDLAITGDQIKMLRVERMSDGHCWGRIYMVDGDDIVLGWSAEKRGKLSITAEGDPALSAATPVQRGGVAECPTHGEYIGVSCLRCAELYPMSAPTPAEQQDRNNG